MRLTHTSLMQSPSPRSSRAGHSITWQFIVLVCISVVGCMLLLPLYSAFNNRYLQTAQILSRQHLEHRAGSNRRKKHLHVPGQKDSQGPLYPFIPLSQASSGFGKKGLASPEPLEEPVWRRAPIHTTMAASKVMFSMRQSSGAVDASRTEAEYESSINRLTAGGHMGAAVAAATAASAKPKERPPVQISPRLKHAVELAAREHSNGYQLTGGVKPRTKTPKKSIEAFQKLRGSHSAHTRFL